MLYAALGSGEIISNLFFDESFDYSTLDESQIFVDSSRQTFQNSKSICLFDDTLVAKNTFVSECPSPIPEVKDPISFFAHEKTPRSQRKMEPFSQLDLENIRTPTRMLSCLNPEERNSFNEEDVINLADYNSPTDHQVIESPGGTYEKELDYQQFCSILATPPSTNFQYEIAPASSEIASSPEYTDQVFRPSSWSGQGLTSFSKYQYLLSPMQKETNISQENTHKKSIDYSSNQYSSNLRFSSDSTIDENQKTKIPTNSKKLRHYSSVADISSAYQRKKKINRHKTAQYRSLSPCLQLRKRRSAKSLKSLEISCSSGIEKGTTSFVNYTPEDSQKILNGVAPSGSNKTKARREKEALEKRQKLSQAALRAVQAVGGDVSSLVEEEFFFQT